MSEWWRTRDLQVAAVLLLFVLGGTWHFRHAVGEDLSSSYVGCRVLAEGQGAHLYAHDPAVFSIVRDPAWDGIAEQANFAPLSLLHPYVQTPLWAYALRPACTRTSFRTFCHVFLLLAMLCTAGTVWLVARFWVPSLFHPGWIALVCGGLALSDPFRYAMFLTQTHVLFLFLTVLALVLAQKERPGWAGLALALAACVKITPGFLLLYWLLSRRYRASLSFVGWTTALVLLTAATAGTALFAAYVRELAQVSNVLLVSFNNQSLAAWWMGRHYPAVELFDWRMYALKPLIKWTSLCLTVACALAGGMMDRHRAQGEAVKPPYGALVTMVGATMFATIAWNHYYVLLVVPLMFLLDAMIKARALWWGGLALTIYALNVYPVAYGSILHLHRSHSIARSEFYAGALCLLALGLLQYMHPAVVRRGREPGPDAARLAVPGAEV